VNRPNSRWPQFSVAEVFAVVSLLSVIWGVSAASDPDRLWQTIAGSLVLPGELVCWKIMRARRREADDPADTPPFRPRFLRLARLKTACFFRPFRQTGGANLFRFGNKDAALSRLANLTPAALATDQNRLDPPLPVTMLNK